MKRDGMLDLNDALQHPGRVIAVDISTEMPGEEDINLTEPVEGFLEAVSTGNQLMVKGEFKTRCTLQCARCGGPLEQDLKFEISEDFSVAGVPSMYAQDDFARIVSEEDFPLFEENNLIVEALIHQGLLINLPQAPLCAYGWDGDCPEARNIPKQRSEQAHPLESLSELLDPEESP
ncbi:MAG: DUF177 domain-containing protein [Chthonomonas sp.]|nr:DUF177 domain-containing protein [Chthonomonas sp.]